MDSACDIIPFHSRRYEAIPLAKIKVINSRNRDQEQFDMNVESIHSPIAQALTSRSITCAPGGARKRISRYP